MIPTLLSVFLSVIPKQYRGRFLSDANLSVQHGAILSGLLQLLGFLGIFIYRYLAFFQYRVNSVADAALAKGAEGALADTRIQASIGILATMEYVFQPLTLVLIYFMFEGVIRLIAAIATNEVVPSLPLQLLGWIHGKVSSRQADIALGPHLEDIVQPGDPPNFDLQILSSRPKAWNTLLTISYQDKLYELDSTAEQSPPHKYVYRLRFIYPGKLVRGLHYYDPKETLEPRS